MPSTSSSSSDRTAPSSTALWNGTAISQVSSLIFNGSGSYTSSKMPRCVGAILKPSGDATRTLQLSCAWFVGGKSKADIEQYQKSLGTYLACFQSGNLTVHGNVYQDVVTRSVNFDPVIHNEYFKYNIEFELAYNSRAFNALVYADTAGGGRSGLFTYTYGDINQSLSTFDFPMYDNLDIVINTSFGIQTSQRAVRSEGAQQVLSGGEHSIQVEGWITDSSVKELEAYFHNFICSVGPCGKKGTLYLGGNSYDNTIFTSFVSEEYSGGDDKGLRGTSAKYTMEFVRGVC